MFFFFLFRIACAPLLFSALLPTLRELVNSGQRKLLIRLYTLGPKVPLPFFFFCFVSFSSETRKDDIKYIVYLFSPLPRRFDGHFKTFSDKSKRNLMDELRKRGEIKVFSPKKKKQKRFPLFLFLCYCPK